MSSLSNADKIISVWIKKGDLEEDSFSKFIYYWVAFNCWFYTKTNKVQDSEALKDIYKRQDLYSGFVQLVAKNKPIFLKLVSICPIKNNRISGREKNINDMEKFEEVVNILYEIRCNLFHGSKLDTEERDKEVVEMATPILEIIVKNVSHFRMK